MEKNMYELNVVEVNNIAGGRAEATSINHAPDISLTPGQMQGLLTILTQTTISSALKDSNKVLFVATNLIGTACSMALGNYLFAPQRQS